MDWKLKLKNVVVIVIENGGGGGGATHPINIDQKKPKTTAKLV